MVGSLLLAGGLVYAAQRLTAPKTLPEVTTTQPPGVDSNWQTTLDALQAENTSTSLPQPPGQAALDQTLQEVQSSNLTTTVGKTLLVNLINANAQGLGSDQTTQDQIIAAASTQMTASQSITYSLADLTIVPDSSTNFHTYGNAFMAVMQNHPDASVYEVLLAAGEASDNNNPTPLQTLKKNEAAYKSVVHDLLAVPVPESFAPFELLTINDFEGMAESIPGMEVLLTDPLQGVVALQQFNSLISEEERVFTNIAQQLQKDGIIFNNNEPGNMWVSFLTLTP